MPQIQFEYTANIALPLEHTTTRILPEVHRILHEVGDVTLNNCKSRVHLLQDYYIGDGAKEHAFVHLQIKLLEGRSDELKQKLGTEILTMLQTLLADAISEFAENLQISVHFIDIERKAYFKIPNNLSPIGSK